MRGRFSCPLESSAAVYLLLFIYSVANYTHQEPITVRQRRWAFMKAQGPTNYNTRLNSPLPASSERRPWAAHIPFLELGLRREVTPTLSQRPRTPVCLGGAVASVVFPWPRCVADIWEEEEVRKGACRSLKDLVILGVYTNSHKFKDFLYLQ